MALKYKDIKQFRTAILKEVVVEPKNIILEKGGNVKLRVLVAEKPTKKGGSVIVKTKEQEILVPKALIVSKPKFARIGTGIIGADGTEKKEKVQVGEYSIIAPSYLAYLELNVLEIY